MQAPQAKRVSIALVPLLAAFAGCSAPRDPTITEVTAPTAEPISTPALLESGWVMQVAYDGQTRINGVACGELDPDAPGDEIASVDRSGRMRVLRWTGTEFEEAFDATRIPVVGEVGLDVPGGELVQVAVGDLDGNSPGDEIVAVGMARGGEDDGGPGLVRYFARTGEEDSWVERRFVTPALVHAIAIGDLQPDRVGDEFVFAGFFGTALIGYVDASTGALLIDETGAAHQGGAKGACTMPNGFVLACDNGETVRYRRAQSGWERGRVVQHGAPLARIAQFEDTDAFAVCANDGTFRLWQGVGGGAITTFFVRAENRLRGAIIHDVDPKSPGVEAATAGYDGEIRVVRLNEETPAGEVPEGGRENAPLQLSTSATSVARDTAKIHHLAVGDFAGIGTALVSCGYSGDVLVVWSDS